MEYVGITLIIAGTFLIVWMIQNRYTRMLNREKHDFAQRKIEKENDIQRLQKQNMDLEQEVHHLENELEMLTAVVDDEGRHG